MEFTIECHGIKPEVVDELENGLSKAIVGHFFRGKADRAKTITV